MLRTMFRLGIELEHAMLVPLAQVEVFAVVAQVRAGEIRLGDAVGFIEAAPGRYRRV